MAVSVMPCGHVTVFLFFPRSLFNFSLSPWGFNNSQNAVIMCYTIYTHQTSRSQWSSIVTVITTYSTSHHSSCDCWQLFDRRVARFAHTTPHYELAFVQSYYWQSWNALLCQRYLSDTRHDILCTCTFVHSYLCVYYIGIVYIYSIVLYYLNPIRLYACIWSTYISEILAAKTRWIDLRDCDCKQKWRHQQHIAGSS